MWKIKMLIDNIKILKRDYPNIYKKLLEVDKENYKNIVIEKAKDGNNTIKYIDNDKSIYIHSKYYPQKEAETLVNDFLEAEGETDHIIVYGVGLGYHILELIKKYPNVRLSLVEPSIEVLHVFLCEVNLNSIPLDNLYIENKNYITDLVNDIINNQKKQENKMFVLNSYRNVFERNYNNFSTELNEAIKNKRSEVGVNFNFQKDWVMNSIKNFSTTILKAHKQLLQFKV